MKKLRAFLAVEVSPQVKAKAVAAIRQLAAAADGIKWVEPENMHITLKFFGDTNEMEVYEISKVLSPALRDKSPLTINLCGIGAFPRLERPRTLWAGVVDGSELMIDLHETLEKSLRQLGYRREHRRYHPHVTLGRVRELRQVTQLVSTLDTLAEFELGETLIDEVILLSSQLHSWGPEYIPLANFPLEG